MDLTVDLVLFTYFKNENKLLVSCVVTSVAFQKPIFQGSLDLQFSKIVKQVIIGKKALLVVG